MKNNTRKTMRFTANPSDLRQTEQDIVIKLAFNILSSDYSRLSHLTSLDQNIVIRLAFNLMTERHRPGQLLSDPAETCRYLRLKYADQKNEVFSALFLDNRHRVIAFEDLFFGTINGASVHPRVVVQRALEINAAAVIFTHNHPSGISEPSEVDRKLTNRLKKVLEVIDVRVLDHIVVGSEETTSFAERGWL